MDEPQGMAGAGRPVLRSSSATEDGQESIPLLPSVRPIAFIQQQVADHFGLTVNVLKSRRRRRAYCEARHIAIWLASKLTRRSLPVIGAAFDRDHTTVMYALTAVERRMESDPDLRCCVMGLEEALRGQLSKASDAEEVVDAVTERLHGEVDRIKARLFHQAKVDPAGLLKKLAGL